MNQHNIFGIHSDIIKNTFYKFWNIITKDSQDILLAIGTIIITWFILSLVDKYGILKIAENELEDSPKRSDKIITHILIMIIITGYLILLDVFFNMKIHIPGFTLVVAISMLKLDFFDI